MWLYMNSSFLVGRVTVASLGLAVHHGLERSDVMDSDVFLLHRDEPIGLEAREQPTDRLERKSEVAADLVARHPQMDRARREPACKEALGQVQQECGQPLLGAHRAEQHHHALVADQLAAHYLVELALQVGLEQARIRD